MTKVTSGEPIGVARAKVREYRGAMNEIARRAGVTRETVRKALDGEWYNEAVIRHTAEVLKERGRKRRELEAKLEQALHNY